jgi:two-component system chemotaxis response regulator CheY
MPNMNGFQLLNEVKSNDLLKHIPVLMVTAEARKEDILLAAKSGAAGYIVKPFTKSILDEKINLILTKLGMK